MMLFPVMDEVYHQPFFSKLSNNLELLEKQFYQKYLLNDLLRSVELANSSTDCGYSFLEKKRLGKKMDFTVFVAVTQQYHTK